MSTSSTKPKNAAVCPSGRTAVTALEPARRLCTRPLREVFQKNTLSLSVPGNSKPKRKSQFGKQRSTTSTAKPKTTRTKEIISPLKAKENELKTTSSKAKQSKKVFPVSQRVPFATLNSDLKRVLGHSPLPAQPEPLKPTPLVASENPETNALYTELSSGLETTDVFPNSWYQGSIKAEIKKIMKQNNPDKFGDLRECFIGSSSWSRYNGFVSDVPMEQFVFPSPSACVSPFLCDPVAVNIEVNTSPSQSPFLIDTLNLNSSQCSESSATSQINLFDLPDCTPVEWMSPIKRPKLFPHKLY